MGQAANTGRHTLRFKAFPLGYGGHASAPVFHLGSHLPAEPVEISPRCTIEDKRIQFIWATAAFTTSLTFQSFSINSQFFPEQTRQ
jgi:hypothetical protein